jgi:O-antigen/teichoic acid export membrane protein
MGAIRKTFLPNLLLLIGANLLIKPIYLLVVEAQVQERAGAESFGLYFALLNLSFVFNIIPDLGITNWNNRHVAITAAIVRQELKQLIRLRLVLGALYLLVCYCIASFLHYEQHAVYLLIVLGINQVLATGVLFFRSYLSGMHAFGRDRVVSILDRVILIVLIGGALLAIPRNEPFPIEWLIFGQTIAYAITLIVAFLLVWNSSKEDAAGTSSTAQSILYSSAPYATLILLSMMSGRIDAIMLERFSGSYETGIYAMVYRLGDMLSMIAYLFAVLLLPIFSRMLAEEEGVTSIFRNAFRLLYTGCLWVFLLTLFQAKPILDLLYDTNVAEASDVLPWTMGAAALFSLQYTTGTLLTAGGRMKPLIIVALLSLVCNVIFNLQLIPYAAAKGAAQAAFMTQLLVFIWQTYLTHRIYGVWDIGTIFRTLAFSVITITGGYILHGMQLNSSAEMAIITILVIASGLLLKMIPLRELFHSMQPGKGHETNPS